MAQSVLWCSQVSYLMHVCSTCDECPNVFLLGVFKNNIAMKLLNNNARGSSRSGTPVPRDSGGRRSPAFLGPTTYSTANSSRNNSATHLNHSRANSSRSGHKIKTHLCLAFSWIHLLVNELLISCEEEGFLRDWGHPSLTSPLPCLTLMELLGKRINHPDPPVNPDLPN